MAEYIEREAFLAEQRHLYCENCARRKNGKGKFVYEIGDAPCRACDIGDVLDAVEDFPAADVRPVVRGKWKRVVDFTGVEAFGFKETVVVGWGCNVCGYEVDASEESFNFCPNCGAKMEER